MGVWRKGLRTRLKISRGQPLAGSNPATPTNFKFIRRKNMNSIYELSTGDFIDLTNLVTVSPPKENLSLLLGRKEKKEDYAGWVYFECNFRFMKASVRFGLTEMSCGLIEADQDIKYLKGEIAKLVKAWENIKEVKNGNS